jgi:formate C-acetyltransferase
MGLGIKTRIKSKIKELPIINKFAYAKQLFAYYKNENRNSSFGAYLKDNIKNIVIVGRKGNKFKQITKLISIVKINPTDNLNFFYSIDENKTLCLRNRILDNYSIDYSWVVDSYLNENNVLSKLKMGQFTDIITKLKTYVRIARNTFSSKYKQDVFSEIESLFKRPAEHLHEALQRILFVNQWLWQTRHKHNGFGSLDLILENLYNSDISSGYISKDEAKQYLKDFFLVIHDKCWFKSTMLLGDTGQIIILGGKRNDLIYHCNDLTYLFIEISKELKLPDPKVLLRVSKDMPDDLLELAIECISTGIGAPLLSNDDVVIPSLIQYGYESEDAYNYATSACWEPLVVGNSCDQNNIQTINFCEPFIRFIDSEDFGLCTNIEDMKKEYYKYLSVYINKTLSRWDKLVFEEDPILTLFNPKILNTGKDITRGGAKYSNLGLTSVGLATVVNSLLNIERLVFQEKRYDIQELNAIRKNNFDGNEQLRKILDNEKEMFGKDDSKVIALTNEIIKFSSNEFNKHRTNLGGRYKFGLSSPSYISEASNIDATFDGRKANMPFATHISGKNGLTPTELINFSSQIDYGDNRINGNVIDFFISPNFIKNNADKVLTMLKGGIKKGFFQMQINVVDSKTLIEAQKHPELFPNLVVRVWGFSAYFKDLPKNYQDNLIKRAIEAELS